MNAELIKDIIQWDIENWKNCIPIWNQVVQSPTPLKCIELGARNGGLSLWAALNNHQVICSDIESPELSSSLLHSKYNCSNLITYSAINALSIPYKNYFDIIFIKSILGRVSLEDNKLKQDAIKSCYNALKPGGKLLIAENLTASYLHKYTRKKFTKWGGKWNYLNLNELDVLFNDFSNFKYSTHGFLATFGRTEKQRKILGKLDNLINPIVPKEWNYLLIGIATK